jgi:copper chaperone
MPTTFKISGMSCGHCVMAVKKALAGVPGISEAKVEIGSAVISAEGALNVEAVKAAIEDAGYDVVSAQ